MSAGLQRWLPRKAAHEAVFLWALGFAALLLAFVTVTPTAKLVATLGYLYLPTLSMRARGEDFVDYGLTLKHWRADLKLYAIMSALVFPLFVVGYLGFAQVMPLLPEQVVKVLTPYAAAPHFVARLPDRFVEHIIDDFFVVALCEEFFYRGFLQARLRDAWPQGRIFLGVRLGPAFWVTAVLFSLGHLAIFQVWRLGVFFPALLFGYMRERTGSIVGAAAFHASSNLLVLMLDAAFFGR